MYHTNIVIIYFNNRVIVYWSNRFSQSIKLWETHHTKKICHINESQINKIRLLCYSISILLFIYILSVIIAHKMIGLSSSIYLFYFGLPHFAYSIMHDVHFLIIFIWSIDIDVFRSTHVVGVCVWCVCVGGWYFSCTIAALCNYVWTLSNGRHLNWNNI